MANQTETIDGSDFGSEFTSENNYGIDTCYGDDNSCNYPTPDYSYGGSECCQDVC
jgi:hypothetical protein